MKPNIQLRLNCEWLWSFVIRARVGFRCELSGDYKFKCKGNLQAAHVVTRGVKGIKYDTRNGRCLCAAHHKYYTHRPEFWADLASCRWSSDWAYLTEAKWQGVATSLDLNAIFLSLREDAEQYRPKFSEYEIKFHQIDTWHKERQ